MIVLSIIRKCMSKLYAVMIPIATVVNVRWAVFDILLLGREISMRLIENNLLTWREENVHLKIVSAKSRSR